MDAREGNSFDTGRHLHNAARPMKVVVDGDGCTWLCDASAHEDRNLQEQGCWRCAEVPFTRND